MKGWPISTDPAPHLEKIHELQESGVSIVNIHSGQPDQRRVIEFYATQVLPKLPRPGAAGCVMQSRLINQAGQQRSFVIVLSSGDEVMACLKRFVEREKIEAAQFSAIGAFRSAVLGYFDWETKDYQRTPVDEQVEVAAFTGDVDYWSG